MGFLYIRLPTEVVIIPPPDVVFLEYCEPAKIFCIAEFRVTYALIEPPVLNNRLGFPCTSS